MVFQDQAILVIDKPAGLIVDTTLADWLVKEFRVNLARGGIVHRLDKDTSGILLVAKTQDSLDQLQSQFQQRLVKKHYLALVHGHLKESGVVTGAVGRHPLNREKFAVVGTGKEAQTNYQPWRRLVMSDESIGRIFADFNKIQLNKLVSIHYPLFTLVECRPVTGRTHQIRVHLKYLGFPVVADTSYAGRKTVRLDHRWCPRQFLHAARIEFIHPISGKSMSFVSKLPRDLKRALNLLKPFRTD